MQSPPHGKGTDQNRVELANGDGVWWRARSKQHPMLDRKIHRVFCSLRVIAGRAKQLDVAAIIGAASRERFNVINVVALRKEFPAPQMGASALLHPEQRRD